MRVVVLGAGGVGGVIGGRLFQHGHDVALVARGAHLDAIRRHGLRLEDPDHVAQLAVPVVGSLEEVEFGPDDIVVLATKTQDAATALDQLRAAAPPWTAVACATNGVEAERLALRRFSAVYGVNVLMPTAYLEPGVVQVISAPIAGSLDVGCHPRGVDDRARALSAALAGSQFQSEPRPDIVRFKYRKLVLNTANAVEAACGRPPSESPGGRAVAELMARARAEAEAVYLAAGLDVATDAEELAKRSLMVYRPIGGRHRGGGSTWQSLARHGSVETDYLNGEIVLLGRLHGVATPVNERMQSVMHELAHGRAEPASVDAVALLSTV